MTRWQDIRVGDVVKLQRDTVNLPPFRLPVPSAPLHCPLCSFLPPPFSTSRSFYLMSSLCPPSRPSSDVPHLSLFASFTLLFSSNHDCPLLPLAQEIPADMVFLASEDSEGLCYVETANLDGESNLKLRYRCQGDATTLNLSDPEQLRIFAQDHFVECELPNLRCPPGPLRLSGNSFT